MRCYRSGPLSAGWAGLCGGLGGRPIQESIYRTRSAIQAVRTAVQEHRPEAVIVQMVRCGWALDVIAAEAPDLPVLFDAIDAMGLHFERAVSGYSLPLQPAARVEAKRCRAREHELAERSDLVVAVTARDLAAIGIDHGRGRVIPVAGRAPRSERRPADVPTILLSGNLGYRPTVAAVLWFAKRVWPEVRRRFPSCRWVLAGARPPMAVRELASLPGIEVHGDVPDLAPFLAESWVALAPMAAGSGVPMKVLEAWAAEVPVVAHPWAAAGVEAEAVGALRQADTAIEWTEAVSELLKDEKARLDIAARGREAWERFYHPDRVAEQIKDAVSSLRA